MRGIDRRRRHQGLAITFRTFAYGPAADQVGDFHPARLADAPVICLLHGGFWRLPYGRDHIAPIASSLVDHGFNVWNLEYRRVGTPGGGWPGTLQDVVAGIDHLACLAESGTSMDLDRITVVGHSAGGHLALWYAGQSATRGGAFQPARIKVSAAVGLAAVSDLVWGHEIKCGNGAIENFLGGPPIELTERYRMTSPAALLPLGVRQLLIHGALDDDVPVDMSRRYAAAAAAVGDDIRYIELPAAGHMDFVDPASKAHATLCRRLRA